MKTFTTLIAATLAATLSTAAFAADGKTVRVNYSDLDLSSDAGKKALNGRISRAARLVCGEQEGPVPLSMQRITDLCIAKTSEQAVAAVQARRDVQMASR